MEDTIVTEYGTLDAQWDEALDVWRIYLHPDAQKHDAEDELWKHFKRFANKNNLEHTRNID